MNKLTIGCGGAALLAIGLATPAAAAPPRLCVPVRATATGQDLGNFHTHATVSVAGISVGTTDAVFTPTGQTGTSLTFAGPIDFTGVFGLGTFTVDATGRVDLTSGAFTSAGPVTGGTGTLRGATGSLTFAGAESLTDGTFTESIAGTICTS